MDLYRIGTENGVKVYKKTSLGDITFIIICILLLLSGIFFGTTYYYRSKYDRLVEQNRVELAIARERAAVLTDTLTRAREEVGAIGESLSRQRTSVSELRELIREIRTRYEKMENLLNSSIGCYDFDDRSFNNTDNNTCQEVENTK